MEALLEALTAAGYTARADRDDDHRRYLITAEERLVVPGEGLDDAYARIEALAEPLGAVQLGVAAELEQDGR